MKPSHQTLLAVALAVAAATPAIRERGLRTIDAGTLRSDVRFLAADERGGRWLGESGLADAEEYIARSFSRLGLEPLPGEEGHFVGFTLYGRHYDPETTYLELVPDGAEEPAPRTSSAELAVDFRPFEFSALGAVEGEVVFAGYGITAPELGWDDYADIDVEGKIVLVFRHHPREDDSRSPFAASGGTEHALFATKAQNAAHHGARGLLLVTDPLHHDRADDLRLQAGLSLHPSRARVARGSLPARHLTLLAMQVSRPLAARLTDGAGWDLAELQRKVDAGMPPAAVDLGVRARLGVTLKGAADPVPGRNVVAFLPGRDPALRDEWVVIGAHHDHVGSFPGEGDTIFNGADDNASGTAGVLALARAFASAPEPPRRSLLFATFSAEERGLLGSRALVESGKLPLERIALMVNLDMIGRNPDRPVEVYGDGYALGLRDIVEAVNESVGLPLSFAGRRYVTNSDHHPFYVEDIPVLFFFTGMHGDYHQVSDHADRLDYERMESIVRLVHGSVERIANAEETPPFVHQLAWLGASIAREDDGVRLVESEPGSQARELGLEIGDLLRAPRDAPRDLLSRLLALAPGGRLEVRREGGEGSRTVELHRPRAGFLGVRIAAVGEARSDALGLVSGEGVLVERVLPETAASAGGIEPGDVLLRVSGRRISPYNLTTVLEEIGAGVTVDLTLVRDGRRRLLSVQLGERP